MSTRPLVPAIGATENALRSLLNMLLAGSAINGYEEWVYLNVRQEALDPASAEELVASALKQPPAAVNALRARLTEGRLLDAAGSLTAEGSAQLLRCRRLVGKAAQALIDEIDPAALEVTVETLGIVRDRAERQLQQ